MEEHLTRLRHIRDLLIRAGHPGADTARLLFFGGTEPASQLRAATASGEARFIGLDDLYA